VVKQDKKFPYGSTNAAIREYFLFILYSLFFILLENQILGICFLQKKFPRSAVLKQAYRNPALARTVPSPAVRAPSILIAAAARNAPVGCEGRSASSRRKSGLHFTLCGFLRSSLSRTPQGRFVLDRLTLIILRRIKYRRIRRRRYRRFCQIRRRLRLFREHPRRFRQQRT